MPSLESVRQELLNNNKSPFDNLRLKYLEQIYKHTGRNVIAYYSGFLQKSGADYPPDLFSIGDSDKSAFMTCSHELDRNKGLDLILHTPGGDIAATESLVEYLQSLYNCDIRAFVPQLAMSGGTLIAMSCKEIHMGRQSSLGPVDPQINGMPAQGIVAEFEQASEDIGRNPNLAHLWAMIIGKYWPTLVHNCKHAIDWSEELITTFLERCMLSELPDEERKTTIERIKLRFGKQAISKTHNRHIGKDLAKLSGLVIKDLEDDQTLQDLVLTLHHAMMLTFAQTMAVKIVENHKGVTYVVQASV